MPTFSTQLRVDNSTSPVEDSLDGHASPGFASECVITIVFRYADAGGIERTGTQLLAFKNIENNGPDNPNPYSVFTACPAQPGHPANTISFPDDATNAEVGCFFAINWGEPWVNDALNALVGKAIEVWTGGALAPLAGMPIIGEAMKSAVQDQIDKLAGRALDANRVVIKASGSTTPVDLTAATIGPLATFALEDEARSPELVEFPFVKAGDSVCDLTFHRL